MCDIEGDQAKLALPQSHKIVTKEVLTSHEFKAELCYRSIYPSVNVTF